MSYDLLAGGYRSSIAHLTFDSDAKTIKVNSTSPTPRNPSWVEPSSLPDVFFSLAEEDDETGLAISLRLTGDKLEVTGKAPSAHAPCHVHALHDGSGIIVSNYLAGTVLYVPVIDGVLGKAGPALKLPFAYEDTPAPNPKRQNGAHAHGAVEEDGLIYVADLGGDRVWVLRRDESECGLEILKYLQCPPGWGPRHMQIHNGTLWVLGEMGHGVLAFRDGEIVHGSEAHVLPDSIPDTYKTFMDGAELLRRGETLYASNRLELHASKMNPSLPALKHERGDSVAMVLTRDGKVEEVRQVRTGCCCVRGMAVSKDGRFVAVAGMCNDVVEVYEIKGERGEEWVFVTSLEIEDVTTFVWL